MITDYGRAVKNIRQELRTYIKANGIKSLVMGISGGIDSALCCALAKPVCDELKIPLIGRSITIETNKEDEISRAEEIGDNLCTDFKEVDLGNGFNEFTTLHMHNLYDSLDIGNRIRLGNVKARMRMIFLYDLAQANGGLVLSTDNYTEYLCGFWTICGDVGDLSPIQHLWKTEVYNMSRYIAEKENISNEASDALMKCVEANPTDGLGVSNSDLDQLGVNSYEEADQIFLDYLGGDMKNENHVLIQRYKRTHFKRNHPYEISRKIILE